jgi:hypothetical protein
MILGKINRLCAGLAWLSADETSQRIGVIGRRRAECGRRFRELEAAF